MARAKQRASRCRTLLVAAILVAGVGAMAVGCGSSGSTGLPPIAAAKTYRLAGFTPAGPVHAGRAVHVALRILQPSGAPILRYRTGSGPHTGIDLIVVPSDLRVLVYDDPPVRADGSISQEVTFPVAGSYRIVVDAFPVTPGVPPNVQFFKTVRVAGAAVPPAPNYGLATAVGGYRFAIQGHPVVHAIQAVLLTVKVTDATGAPAVFTPFDGAIAHAIFFREGSLDYFHTHICAPNAPACTSSTRGPAGSATTPGILRVGALLPVAGRWRMFLRTKIAGRELVTPFTLVVR